MRGMNLADILTFISISRFLNLVVLQVVMQFYVAGLSRSGTQDIEENTRRHLSAKSWIISQTCPDIESDVGR